jgi:murein DD-endopeptidase MepM/ murein hydrolase activator NlpD
LKWWPDVGVRPTLHEGIDFCYYGKPSGQECAFTPDIHVPVMAEGEVVAVCPDYLGRTVFLDHCHDSPLRFLSIYAHMVPHPDIQAGRRVEAGEVIGTIADTTGRKNRMPAHLHLSIMEVEKEVPPEHFTWDLICNSELGRLLDPLQFIEKDMIEKRLYNHWKEQLLNEVS